MEKLKKHAFYQENAAFSRIRLFIGHTSEFSEKRRNFAYCTIDAVPSVYVAPKLERQRLSRIKAVLAHELAHATLILSGDTTHAERTADAVAERLFRIRISYDPVDLVQTTGPGLRPRPASLPQ